VSQNCNRGYPLFICISDIRGESPTKKVSPFGWHYLLRFSDLSNCLFGIDKKGVEQIHMMRVGEKIDDFTFDV
jgi:hypothetical protein